METRQNGIVATPNKHWIGLATRIELPKTKTQVVLTAHTFTELQIVCRDLGVEIELDKCQNVAIFDDKAVSFSS